MNYIDSEHLQNWIKSGQASVVSAEVCRDFHDVLLTFPWTPTRIDWGAVEHVTMDLDEVDNAAVAATARARKAPLHTHVLVLFTPDQPGLVCRTEDALENLDHLYWKAPGARYFCGADASKGRWEYHHHDFGEFDGIAKVTLRVQRSA
ncbi:hypothetical protein ACFY1U_44870 [Streptomyces sp. NPDC001351]|uniref:hypothetical protein n=1 Tax=Streptomyces sp. NPDC001351 TaxID=3364564 RepID=UPI00368CD33E